jgi:hypothetical protein
MNDQPPLYIKIVVRSAGAVSIASILWMLSGAQLPTETWMISGAGILLWVWSEWDWWRQGKSK